jgi:hypothetical protein
MDKEDYYPIVSSDSSESFDKKLKTINQQNDDVNKELNNDKPKRQEMKEKKEEDCCCNPDVIDSCCNACFCCGIFLMLNQR